MVVSFDCGLDTIWNHLGAKLQKGIVSIGLACRHVYGGLS